MNKGYVIKGNLQHREASDLVDFLNNRLDSKCLHRLVQEKASIMPIVYRGLKYRKKDLQVGHQYEHRYLLSSWSLDQKVAMSFALDGYIPDKMIEEVCDEKGYDLSQLYKDQEIWDECEKEYVNVLLICEGVKGFWVNDHLHHDYFAKESEVIVYDGKWVFENISYKKTEKGYPYVEVKAIWLPEHITKVS